MSAAACLHASSQQIDLPTRQAQDSSLPMGAVEWRPVLGQHHIPWKQATSWRGQRKSRALAPHFISRALSPGIEGKSHWRAGGEPGLPHVPLGLSVLLYSFISCS